MNLVHQFYFSEKLKNVVTWEKNKKRKRKERDQKGVRVGEYIFKHPVISILKLASFSSLASIGIPYFSITFAVDVLVNQ